MASSDSTYNGWTNYATWGVALVLDNDQGTQEYVQTLAHRSRAEAVAYLSDPDNAGSVLTEDQCTEQNLEYAIKDLVEEMCEIPDTATQWGPGIRYPLMARQVIQAGLAEVNWREIAQNVLADR